MASELERIANRLRFLSGQAEQHRATVYDASQRFKDAAQAIVRTTYEQMDGLDRPPPQQLVGRLTQAATGAESAIAPLTRTAGLLRGFAASLAASTAAPVGVPAFGIDGFVAPDQAAPDGQQAGTPDVPAPGPGQPPPVTAEPDVDASLPDSDALTPDVEVPQPDPAANRPRGGRARPGGGPPRPEVGATEPEPAVAKPAVAKPAAAAPEPPTGPEPADVGAPADSVRPAGISPTTDPDPARPVDDPAGDAQPPLTPTFAQLLERATAINSASVLPPGPEPSPSTEPSDDNSRPAVLYGGRPADV